MQEHANMIIHSLKQNLFEFCFATPRPTPDNKK